MKLYKKYLNSALIILAIILIVYLSGCRLSGIQAAKAHFDVGKDAILFEQVDYKWGTVYLFKTGAGPRTVISEKKLFLWSAKTAFHMDNEKGLVKTVGWGNSEKCTVYAVESRDGNLSYIEMGPTSDRIRLYAIDSNPMVFHWDKPIRWNDLNGIAYSKNGKILYEFRYPRNTNSINPSDIRWFQIN